MTFNCKTDMVMDYREGTSSGLTAHQLFRQSFDRFDDNLAENILSYLIFSEKVLFESVFKQWKKCIYNQQKELSLMRWETEDDNSLNKLLEPIEVIDYKSATAVANGFKRVNKFWLKSVLKKCKSIERVVLDAFVDLEDVRIICRYSPKLKSIDFETTGLSSDDLDHLGNRYGHLFERVNFFYSLIAPKYWNRLLIHCKNLKELLSQNISELLIEDINYLPKLEMISSYQLVLVENDSNINKHDNDKNLLKFDQICDKFSETLNTLSMSLSGDTKTKELESSFNSVCKLKKLKSLTYNSWNVIAKEQGFEKYLSQLAQNIPELKKLSLSLYSCDNLKIDNIFNAFKEFRNLVELDLFFSSYGENTTFNASVECLKTSQNVKDLCISIETISEEFFEDIDKHLPNLIKLEISCESEISDKTIAQLSRLKKLRAFYLNRYRKCLKNVSDESVCAVINGCPALQVLCFTTRPNITNKTIETLINCVNSDPKRKLRFECGIPDNEDVEQIPPIDMISFVDKIPQNLTINYVIVDADGGN